MIRERQIAVHLPVQSLSFRPGGSPVAFSVQVRNDSDRQAQFQLEVLAAGAEPQAVTDWYQLSPEVSVAKPPGDVTDFQVHILDTPLPGFVGTIHLTIRVVSPQLSGEVRRIVRLTIQPSVIGAALELRLPAQPIHVYPRHRVEIPVQVRNLTPNSLEVKLSLFGIAASWLPQGSERRTQLLPHASTDLTFLCQLPAVVQSLSQPYAFWVEAVSPGSASVRADGVLEVLPVGFVQFAVLPQQQTVPAASWRPNWTTRSAYVQAGFKNVSNVVQSITVELRGRDRDRCTYRPPEAALLGLGESATLPFEIGIQRPWIGWRKILRLQAVARPQDEEVAIEPDTHDIELRILPRIPLGLLLALLAILAALLALWLRPEPIGHTDFVNAVRFSRDALSAVSGSDDCTIRRWQVAGEQLRPEGRVDSAPTRTCNDEPLQPQGVLAFTHQTVFSLEFSPRDNDHIAAGLANGAIQLWHLPTRRREAELRDASDRTEDRVFDLVFSRDARTLYSGHGSGTIRVWTSRADGTFEPQLANPAQVLRLPDQPSQQVNYQVRALALSSDGQLLVSAGSKNTLVRWDLTTPDPTPHLLLPQESEEDYIWDVAFSPRTQRLAASDSRGHITLWQLDQCSPAGVMLNCPHWSWQATASDRPIAVRSIQFSSDGRHLISASDDGQIRLWTLPKSVAETSAEPSTELSTELSTESSPELLTDTILPPSKLLSTRPQKVNTLDLVETDRDWLILSGGDDHQVHVQRLSREDL